MDATQVKAAVAAVRAKVAAMELPPAWTVRIKVEAHPNAFMVSVAVKELRRTMGGIVTGVPGGVSPPIDAEGFKRYLIRSTRKLIKQHLPQLGAGTS